MKIRAIHLEQTIFVFELRQTKFIISGEKTIAWNDNDIISTDEIHENWVCSIIFKENRKRRINMKFFKSYPKKLSYPIISSISTDIIEHRPTYEIEGPDEILTVVEKKQINPTI